MNPAGKVALITGGARRVGRAISLALAGLGAHVAINYHTSAEAAQETAAAAAALGVEALAVQADVGDRASVEAMAAAVQARFGGIDILVNSASHFETSPFPTTDVGPWERVTRVLIDGPFFVANACTPSMRARGGGVIINIVDLSAWRPWRNFTAHAVGKAALLALTRQLALELAPSIRVNAVAPGYVLPPPHFDAAKIERAAQRTLLKRWGSPADVAQAVRYLVEADFVTGEVIVVDGGERLDR